MLIRLLFTAAVVCTVAFVFYLLGRETERCKADLKRIDAEYEKELEELEKQHAQEQRELNEWATACRAAVEQAQLDTAEMMREMEFYGEASEVVNARGGQA